MGDAGEGLIDAEARIQERMEELERERRAPERQVVRDPENVHALESLRLARTELERQLEATTHERRKAQIPRRSRRSIAESPRPSSLCNGYAELPEEKRVAVGRACARPSLSDVPKPWPLPDIRSRIGRSDVVRGLQPRRDLARVGRIDARSFVPLNSRTAGYAVPSTTWWSGE